MKLRTLRTFSTTSLLLSTCATLAACSGGVGGKSLDELDWDLRGGSVMTTADAARSVTEFRPMPDARGVISYPGYQVAVARLGDTAASVAARVGLSGPELAHYNAIDLNAPLRDGERLALPRRIGDGSNGFLPGSAINSGSPGSLNVSSIATTALDRVGTAPVSAAIPAPAPPSSGTSMRHQVKRGETAFSIARTYGISARALADQNGLGPDFNVREKQYLIIPTGTPPEAKPKTTAPAKAATSTREADTPPTPPAKKLLPTAEAKVATSDANTPTTTLPSNPKPLPAETPKTANEVTKETPPEPSLETERTTASSTQFVMPVSGNIIRPYAPKKNEGIDIAAPAGTPVKAAAAGIVAAITQDTEQTPIIVIRHDGGILTVYAGVAGITLNKGDKVARGQQIATVRSGNPAFLHFEVRRGVNSTDPTPYLQ